MNKNNTTGYSGISFDSTNKKYKSYFYVAGDRIKCGYSDNIELAKQKQDEVKALFANSDNKLLTYLQLKLPNVEEDLLKQYIIGALKNYVISGDGCMFYGFCKKYILNEYHKNRMPENGDLTWEIFEKRMTGITRPIILDGKSILQIRNDFGISYDQVIDKLEKLII